jgi:hypothetical protein
MSAIDEALQHELLLLMESYTAYAGDAVPASLIARSQNLHERLAALAPQQAAPMLGVKAQDVLRSLIGQFESFDQAPDDAAVWMGGWSNLEAATRLRSVQAGDIRAALATPEAGTSEPVAWFRCSYCKALFDHDDELCGLEKCDLKPAPAQAPVDGEVVRALLSRLIYLVDTSINPRGWELREEPMIEEAVRYIQEALAAAPSARKEP